MRLENVYLPITLVANALKLADIPVTKAPQAISMSDIFSDHIFSVARFVKS